MYSGGLMAPRLTIVKKFTYRGDASEEWSNTYAFEGADPADSAAWLALFNALVTQEKTLYPATVTVVRGYGYTSDAADAVAVWSRDLVAAGATVAGTHPSGGEPSLPGDAAAWIRWKTSRLTSKGKPIYIRKYYHGLFQGGSLDLVQTSWRTAALAFGAKLWDGTFIDGRTIRAPGTSDETIVGTNCSVYVTTRTLKRRGRRPPTP